MLRTIWGKAMNTMKTWGYSPLRSSSFSDQAGLDGFTSWCDFPSWDARINRYTVNWGLYTNDLFDGANPYSEAFKANKGLYSAVRGALNPATRLGNFWGQYLLGGKLDPEGIKGALPILTDDAALRAAVCKLWKDSNWEISKEVWAKYGAIMGDAPLSVQIDAKNGRIYLVPLDPRKITDYVLDARGNVKMYEFQERRPDPDSEGGEATFCLRVSREGQACVYRTFKNDQPYGWDGAPQSWSYDFGFVPLVWCKHLDNGAKAGYSELHATISKAAELADQASLLSDYNRQRVKTPRAIMGEIQAPTIVGEDDPNPQGLGTDEYGQSCRKTKYNPGLTRDAATLIMFGNPNTKIENLVADMSVGDAIAWVAALDREIRADHLELDLAELQAKGEITGPALALKQQPVQVKVMARRAAYHACLVRANQMAVTIGGVLGFEGYEGFALGSFEAGELDHQIGDSPVFAVVEADRLAEVEARAAACSSLIALGFPPELALAEAGYPQDVIKLALPGLVAAKARQDSLEEEKARGNDDEPGAGGGSDADPGSQPGD